MDHKNAMANFNDIKKSLEKCIVITKYNIHVVKICQHHLYEDIHYMHNCCLWFIKHYFFIICKCKSYNCWEWDYNWPFMSKNMTYILLLVKVALGVCFALKSWKECLLPFTYLITLGKDVTFPLITKFKTNRPLSYLFVNQIPN